MAAMIIFVALCIVSVSTKQKELYKGLEKWNDWNSSIPTKEPTRVWYNYSSDPTTPQGPTTPIPTYNCTKQYSCLDCSTARVCAPTHDGQSFYEIKRFTCPSNSPYCDPSSGTCSSTQSSNCSIPAIASNFTCMRDGYFPDPNNCSRYYVCQDEVAYMYTCQSPYSYYSVSTRSCIGYSWYCANYYTSCNGYSGRKIGVSQYPYNIFFYCVNNTAIAVDRCIGAYQFNSYYQTCVATCPRFGLFPRDDDCANYYKCSPASNNPQDSNCIMTNMTCPAGQGFSEEDYQCVNRSSVRNCNVPYKDLMQKK